MTTSSSGFSGSVTKACRMCVVIGSSRRPCRAISVLQPAVQLITVPASIVAAARADAASTRPLCALDPGHLGVGVDLGAAASAAAREAPDDRVVADDPARRVVERRP